MGYNLEPAIFALWNVLLKLKHNFLSFMTNMLCVWDPNN